MKLKTTHIQNYRSIRDTGVFEVEAAKTILVGSHVAGRTLPFANQTCEVIALD
jgi:Predicted ATP-dependent endonuclease of the OLD family